MTRHRIESLLLSGAAIVAGLVALAAGPAAAGLQEFRAPNELEKAYLAVAAELGMAPLCEKISNEALNRVRKPTMVRSQCYYYVALNTRDPKHCVFVEEIPAGVGVMNWLTPERCEIQIGRLQASEKPYLPTFDPKVALHEMGYMPDDLAAWTGKDGKTDAHAAFRRMISPASGTLHEDFLRRLDALPDFSKTSRAEDQLLYFTKQQEDREFYWVLNHGMKLCLAGHGGPNCNDESYSLFRKNKQDFAKLLGRMPVPAAPAPDVSRIQADAPSGYREPALFERAYYDIALRRNDTAFCAKIAPESLAIGWSVDPGLVFMSLRSACYNALAVRTRDEGLCREVRPLARSDIDGDGLTGDFCRAIVAGGEAPVHKLTLRPSWREVLKAVGYDGGQIPEPMRRPNDGEAGWLAFADHLMDARGAGHAEFIARMRAAPDAASDPGFGGDAHALAELEIQKILYQFAVVRFHCSVNQSAGKYAFQGYTLKAPKNFGGAFELVDHHGNKVTDQDFRGRYLLVYFGYTYCPDVCPTSLWTIGEALRGLGDDAARIQPLFISVDPGRDTPEQLAAYVELFHPGIVGLTGEAEAIRKAAKTYQAYYFVGQIDGEYVVDHTSWTYLLDPEGKAIGYFDHGIEAGELADRLRKYLSRDS